jgi:hypothetical protein
MNSQLPNGENIEDKIASPNPMIMGDGDDNDDDQHSKSSGHSSPPSPPHDAGNVSYQLFKWLLNLILGVLICALLALLNITYNNIEAQISQVATDNRVLAAQANANQLSIQELKLRIEGLITTLNLRETERSRGNK